MNNENLKLYDDVREFTLHIINQSNDHSLAMHIDQIIESFCSLNSKNEHFELILRDTILPKWINILDAKNQIEDINGKQKVVREHCYRLSNILHDVEYNGPSPKTKINRNGEIISWESASEWLDIAAGVSRVRVITGYYDESLMWCSSARNYEDERSNLMSHLATQLTVFNFAWGSLETTIKLINPSKIPKTIKSGGTSWIDRAIFFLKNEYEPTNPIPFYDETVFNLRKTLKLLPHYNDFSDCFRISPFQGVSGIGINVVRRIRNQFAHGTMKMPIPVEEDQARSSDAILIELSTRIVLHTIQMLLLAYLKDSDFDVDRYHRNEWGETITESIHNVLRGLHYEKEEINQNQLPLF